MMLVMGMIFYLSHLPGDSLGLPDVAGIDKIFHIIAYGCLAAAFLYGLHSPSAASSRTVTVIVVTLFCLLFGIADEYHQSFIPLRSVSIWDVAADISGALLAVAWWYRGTTGTAGGITLDRQGKGT